MDKLKLVKTIVFILTFLLVFGSLVLLGSLFKGSRTRLPEEISLGEPAGSTLQKIEIRDNLLYIGISDGGKSDRIIIIDTASGRKISTIRID